MSENRRPAPGKPASKSKAASTKAKPKPATPSDNPSKAELLEKVRALCGAFEGVVERPSHGAPTFFLGTRRTFLSFVDNHHGDGRLAVWCYAAPGMQSMLVESNADVYFVPPYVGPAGWVGVRLDRDADWSEIAAVIEQAFDARRAKR